jgi:putative membrane protein
MPMSPGVKVFVQRWIINTLAVLVATCILGDARIHYDRAIDLIVASLLLGILNAFVRPVLMLIALPLVLFTLGLFILVINALLLYFVGFIVRGFHVADFWSAFWGALIIGVISLTVNMLTGTGRSRVEIKTHRKRADVDSHRDDGGGPVIDV